MAAQQSLRGKNAIVTGGSRGIGKGIAFELARRGANILLTYNSSRQQAEEVASQIRTVGVDAIAVEGKADDLSAPKNIVDAAVQRWGCIDIVINNAGAREDYPVEEMTYEAFDRQIAVNLRFPVFLIKEATRHFGQAPRIVNLSSVYARDGQPGCLAYVASKGAMESLTRSLAKELGHKYNATINCVSPGPVNTELWASTTQDPEAKEEWDRVIQSTPAAPRVAEVDDIAQIVAFLSEEGSRWTTGSLINANGGLLFV
ncbi:gluconate 5-dehydrogenase [Aspergillus nomiae NRRL 13137]|uniref:Gluconate 5-dehydrogenase n=1 Tax=Aspergillus nomiae NRRL (strain ATCC 15546 / NRRL 13137 / CBS 260.88 / M93) TaxID=1509407 RepID=A0A0L1INA4_ASPN3|nr:gluconate 5-dehydrogenase [Aspergillus nomiae NRRL 13137]KNG80967.1 gluconate 5-dehydrogenase [Aspergillus nomiae NRRL 13137]